MVKRLFRLQAREWRDLARALAAVVRAQVMLRFRRRGQLLAYDGEAASVAPDGPVLQRIRELELAVSRAARFGPVRPKCLARSMALHRLLTSDGIRGSRIRVGVKPGPDGLTAHAWVTVEDRVVGDDPFFVRQFTEIADARASGLT